MTSAAPSLSAERTDVRTVVGSGLKLGVATAAGVVVFALLSRATAGSTETIVQSVVVLLGGAVAAYYPAAQVAPRSVDSIGWTSMVGLLGALVFTVIDTAVLRPVDLYHWRWDAIGGGSGFWYVPVWWMGAAVLAWLGGWVHAEAVERGGSAHPLRLAIQTVVLGGLVAALFIVGGLAPFHSASVALGFGVALVLRVVVARLLRR